MAPAFSANFHLANNSDVALVYDSADVIHGDWSPNMPPARIVPGETKNIQAESTGAGAAGVVYYRVEVAPTFSPGVYSGYVRIDWNIPVMGTNTFPTSTPPGYKMVTNPGPPSQLQEDNAEIYLDFSDASSTGDGIPDDWKINGVWLDPLDGGAKQFIDLPAMGATVAMPDIFVQLDHMAVSGAGGHSHALSAKSIKMVVDAFKNSKYKSKNGSTGINLHIDAGSSSIMNFATSATWGTLSKARELTEIANLGTGDVSTDGKLNCTKYNWTAFDQIKKEAGGFRSTGRASIFRYAIAAHQIITANNSGEARQIPGSDFIVSLGSFTGTRAPADPDAFAAFTFMHELGHCLGLMHGGGDNANNKPNYISIMNYSFQPFGVDRAGVTGICDYSNQKLMQLKEKELDETIGLQAAASRVGTRSWSQKSKSFAYWADASNPIDWDDSGIPPASLYSNSTKFDVNGDGTISDDPLEPFDDWENLRLKGGCIGGGADVSLPIESGISEIKPSDVELIKPSDTKPPVTTFAIVPPFNAEGWNRTDVTITLTAQDDLSGVRQTLYAIDGAAPTIYSTPITITTEGIHNISYYSIDRAGNIEGAKQAVVKIDKTPPEAHISYDPERHRILVTGQDALSGVNQGLISPSAVARTEWTSRGSDVAEERLYEVFDEAGNSLKLDLRVRIDCNEFEINIVRLSYNDTDAVITRRNTIIFRRVVGCCNDGPLLAVLQRVALGDALAKTPERAVTQFSWNALDCETRVSRWREHTPERKTGRAGDHKTCHHSENCERRCGLLKLCVVTDSKIREHLKILEPKPTKGAGDGDEQDEARGGPSLDGDEHGQPCVDVQESGSVGKGREARGPSDGDEQDEARGGLPLDANKHGQPCVDLHQSGPVGEAEKLFVQVMETRQTKLGADHPDTLTSMNNLTFTCKSQGRHADALALMKDCAQLGNESSAQSIRIPFRL